MLDEETEVALKSSCQRTGLSKADTERAITWARSVMTDHGLLENIKLGHMDLCGFQDGEPLFKLSPRGVARST